jgi:hypothetical protein
MVEEDSLTELESEELIESIETIFNNILEESDEYTEVCNVCGDEVDVTVDGGETDDNGYYTCSECTEEMNESENEIDFKEIFKTIDSLLPDGESGCYGDSNVGEKLIRKAVDKYGFTKEAAEYIAEFATENFSDQDGGECRELEDIYYDLVNEIEYILTKNTMTEGLTLKKTSSKQRRDAMKYRNSAAGKKSLKLNARKRKKYATKIARCAEKDGMSFSLRSMKCTKAKKRR